MLMYFPLILLLYAQYIQQLWHFQETQPMINRFIPRFCFASKQIIAMKPTKVAIDLQVLQSKQKTTINQAKQKKEVQEIPDDWQTLQFDKLCALSSQALQKLSLQIRKSKMNADDSQFASVQKLQDPQSQLTPYWINIYKTLCNLQSINEKQIDLLKKASYLGQMLLDEPLQSENLKQIVTTFVNNIHEVKKLQGIAQPTFCKYLLSLKRDLLLQGLDINSHISHQSKQVKLKSILSYEYEFWSDVKHNRAKNGNEEQFIIEKRKVDNPNNTLLILEKWPKINITYISRKKKRKQYDQCFCMKTLLEIEVDGNTHVIKVQKKGPTSSTEPQGQIRNQYAVIDYDNIFNGNQTIRPIFQF